MSCENKLKSLTGFLDAEPPCRASVELRSLARLSTCKCFPACSGGYGTCKLSTGCSGGYTGLANFSTQSGQSVLPRARQHMVQDCIKDQLNPARAWTFSDEDAMMKWGKCARRSHGGVVAQGALRRWLLQFISSTSIV